MKIDERKNYILEMLKQNGSVKVTELSKLMNISEVTVRSYLSDLEDKGLLSRVHGGAISSYRTYYSMNLTQRLETNNSEKMLIARHIASMVKSGDTVMLNSGTTTLLTFRMIPKEYSLNIVTNSLGIALEAANFPGFNVVLVGGSVNAKYQFTYGSDALNQIKEYHADKLILSVDGIDPEGGFSTYYEQEAPIDRAMLMHSGVRIIAADYTKFLRNAFVKIADIDSSDYIVTNSRISTKIKNDFQALGTDVLLAEEI